MSKDKLTCWFCGEEVDDYEEGVEFSWVFEYFLHLPCLENACYSIMPSEVNYFSNRETILIMEEMNEKGYEFKIGDEE